MKEEPSDHGGKNSAERRREAAALKAIWNETAAERKALGVGSQLAFGARYNIGNQSAVGFFLNGDSPLSLKAARGFAEGLGCRIADFSPRLAALLEPDTGAQRHDDAAGSSLQAKAVASLSPRSLSLALRLDALTDEQSARMIYATVTAMLKSAEAEQRGAARQQTPAKKASTPARRRGSPQPGRVR